LRSNHHLDKFKEVTLYKLRFLKLFGVSKQKILPLLEARSEYLEAAWDQISQDYGSVGGYVREGLGFSDEDTRRLKRLFLQEG
ncbi:MAG: tyrosine-protein phosphatase, partial [Desulfobacterales bacterium]